MPKPAKVTAASTADLGPFCVAAQKEILVIVSRKRFFQIFPNGASSGSGRLSSRAAARFEDTHRVPRQAGAPFPETGSS